MEKLLKDFLRGTSVNHKCRKINIFEDLGVCWSNLAYPFFVQAVVPESGFKREIS